MRASSRHRLQRQPIPGAGVSAGRSSHQQPAESAPQLNSASQRAQFLSVGKAREGPTEEGRLPAEVRAAIANKKMQAQRQALDEAEAAVEALGHEAGRLFAVEQHRTHYGSNGLQSPYSELSGVYRG